MSPEIKRTKLNQENHNNQLNYVQYNDMPQASGFEYSQNSNVIQNYPCYSQNYQRSTSVNPTEAQYSESTKTPTPEYVSQVKELIHKSILPNPPKIDETISDISDETGEILESIDWKKPSTTNENDIYEVGFDEK